MSFCEPQSVSECYVDNTYGARRAREKRKLNAREKRVQNVLAVIYALDVLVVVCALMAVVVLFGFMELEGVERYFNSLQLR